MATYKVIQDIEAEDKLLGPLTLKQFVYAVVVVVSLFIAFQIAIKLHPLLALPFLPHTIVFAFLAAPFGKDQPNEIWLAAKIRFFIKPRKRIWNQTGAKELVTITAPKKLEQHYSDGLSQTQVKSRLSALASTLDSRGWAVKNINVNLSQQPVMAGQQTASDRLVDPSSIPQEVANVDVGANDDIFDEQNNAKAQQLTQMIDQSTQSYRDRVRAQMGQQNNQPAQAAAPKPQQPARQGQQPPPDYWFMSQQPGAGQPPSGGYSAFGPAPIVAPQDDTGHVAAKPASDEEKALLERLHKEQDKTAPTSSHLKTIKPLAEQKAEAAKRAAEASQKNHKQPSPKQVDPAIMGLVNNNDLNVETISRQANKKREDDLPEDEVVVSLH